MQEQGRQKKVRAGFEPEDSPVEFVKFSGEVEDVEDE